MAWFVEEKTFKGTWTPAVYYSGEPPTEKRLDGRVTFRAPPVRIKEEHSKLSLKDLRKIYGIVEACK